MCRRISDSSEMQNEALIHRERAKGLHRLYLIKMGGGPRVVVSTAAFHARVWGSVPGLSSLKETKIASSPSMCESQYCEPP